MARVTFDGRDQIAVFGRPDAGDPAAPTDFPPTPCVSITTMCAHGDGVVVLGATPDRPSALWSWAPAPHRAPEVPTLSSTIAPRPADIAHGTPLHFEGRTGRTVHATLYRPTLTDIDLDIDLDIDPQTEPPPDTRAPLIVFCHSGPTANTTPGFDPALQFFTTRGFAVATVDYAGSSGYGRTYRQGTLQRAQWGVADAHDCLDTALHLATHHRIDATRMAIRGTSAGGFTALNALAAGEGFTACASWYGVTDLLRLAATTHDFEAHYNDRLVGPLPEAEARYVTRSPVNHAAAMTGAVLLLQGADDPVVPLSQAQILHDALRASGRLCELHVFEGEGHGFRRAETLAAAYRAELAFYRTHLRL